MPHPPTPEQQQAIDMFATGDSLVIEAGAGTGKTTTLAMVARTTPRTGTYLAFNRSIAQDAGQALPNTVQARTVHSLAMRPTRATPTGRALLDRLNGARISSPKAARLLGLGPLVVTVPQPEGPARTKVLQPSWQASHIIRAVRVFCQSADPEPGPQHFPYVEGIDPLGADGRHGHINNRQVARELTPYLLKAWDDLTNPSGLLRFEHDVYLKLAQLAAYEIPGEYLLFDEAQDASPVMLAWLAAQGDRQVIYVGDSQQQIYEWRGAINALAAVDDTVPRTFLTQSWRFGPPVADIANLVLDQLDADLRLRGTPSIDSTVTFTGPPSRAVLCRTNAAAVNAVLNAQAAGRQPHLVGGADDIVYFARAAAALQNGERTGHPELACFENWREVQAYVADDPAGDELRMMVHLLDQYGIQIVIDALDGLIAEEGADVIVSTAHRSKGREWPTVQLAPDFQAPEGRPTLPPGEWRLLYVAATRATTVLDIGSCLPLRALLEDPEHP